MYVSLFVGMLCMSGICIYICIYVYIYGHLWMAQHVVCVCVCARTRVCACVRVCVCVGGCGCGWVLVCECVFLFQSLSTWRTCVWIPMYADLLYLSGICMYICICIHINGDF